MHNNNVDFYITLAGAINVLVMRYSEGIHGVLVCDAHGDAHGVSITAGRLGLMQVAATRCVLPAPILLCPPIIMNAVEKSGFFTKYPKVKLPTHVVVSTGMIDVGVIMCIMCTMYIIDVKLTYVDEYLFYVCVMHMYIICMCIIVAKMMMMLI